MMSRKNLLTSFTERKLTAVNSDPGSDLSPAVERNRSRGAFGAITRSIDELAEKAQTAKEIESRLLEGATVIELDPDTIDISFVSDRIGDDKETFEELVEAIRQRGQDSPILVRPHPGVIGRYMTVFGHRRARAAKVLGRPVKAVVKELDDRDHVIAQGQENSARADLSFIEKAVFAGNLECKGYDREIIMAALSVDKTVVSKMISVTKDIPPEIITAIGAAKNSGRDRWYDLAKKLREGGVAVKELMASDDFNAATSDERLEMLAQHMAGKRLGKIPAPTKREPIKSWVPTDRSVSVTLKKSAKKAIVTLEAADGSRFAEFITGQLDDLYVAFRMSTKEATGD
ncbi:MAG: plasmid partitioning protein RepB [Mesorhizobium sp.]|nr:plasmid partitioning protein RepB [Mesorhizobium sp. M00.F.Ca.ET.217.01.1.1]TGV85488.1 plasmid partitioning protein RepB [Mesorhizobium sp. M00.F.Ca.ET.158.01.1.1]TIT97064.1 MAG: plasmid partitioning protein RepB [Mesorhizobium sp.]TIU85182.1 MAG: plasmid partitioning protein RepB [Mesorhizobium sp.]TKB35615.1 MAG: plasmid partitioning protein RepB [Mesorhizobium sp.]